MPSYETDDYFDLNIDGKQVRSAKKALSPERQEAIRRQFDTKKAGSVFNADETRDVMRPVNDTARELQRELVSTATLGPLALATDAGRHVINGVKKAGGAAWDGLGYGVEYASDLANQVTEGAVGNPLSASLRADVASNGVNLTPQAQAELANLPPDAAPQEQQQPPNYVMAGPNSSPSSQVSQAISGATRGGGTVAPRRGGNDFGAKGINAAFDAQANAERSAAAVGAQRAAEEYGYQQEKTALLEADVKKAQTFEARRKSINDDQTQKLEAIQQRLASLSGEVDPQRFWKGKDTSSKIAAAVGIFLGGLGGGPNRALDIVNNAVAQDIEAQQQSFQNAMTKGKTEFELQSNLYGQHLRALGDEQLASLATRDAMLGVVEQKLTTTGAKYKTPELQANLEKSLAGIQMERAKVQSDLMAKRDASAARWAQISMQREEIQARQKVEAEKARNKGAPTMADMQKQAQDYGKDVQAISQYEGALKTLLGVARGSGDVPGTGMLDSRKPEAAKSDSDVSIEQAKEQLGSALLFVRSGAGVSDKERETTLRSYGLHPSSSEQQFRIGVKKLEQEYQGEIGKARAKYDPRAVALYESRRPGVRSFKAD